MIINTIIQQYFGKLFSVHLIFQGSIKNLLVLNLCCYRMALWKD